jgi:hypothetical protein
MSSSEAGPYSSIVDWHRFDADPDPNFHVDTDRIGLASK